jgi:cysteinyl-tRNA synthetase
MELRLYDTLSREKRPFKPLDPARVRMYVCGPTVYDFAHIGNARPVIVFDVLFRLLRHLYGADRVVYARNITDVDDKINARAAEEYPGLPLNRAIRRVTQKTDRQFHKDVEGLGCLPPTIEPRATEHITEMKVLIERLVASGHAYVAASHVLFDVPSMPDYGELSKRSLDEMIAGARVEVAPFKRNPMDFVLWKPSKSGEPSWPSPAGIAAPGRPGWHIECSAMSWKHLGETFDIHGGGIDLVFPHHENEIAQSRSALHTPLMANYWMHNGFLQVEGEKMSKSLGNFVTIRELREGWKGRKWEQSELRLLMLSSNYRQPLDWTLRGLEDARRVILDWKNVTANVAFQSIAITPSADLNRALMDDLNTPQAIYVLHSKARDAAKFSHAADELYSDLVFLGIFGDRKIQSEQITSAIKEGTSAPNDKSQGIRTQLDRTKVNKRLYYRLRKLEPSSNSATVATTVMTNIKFINPIEVNSGVLAWSKYGPQFLSSSDRVHIAENIGITTLNKKIEDRLAARRAKNFHESDRIRDELAAIGIILRDSKDGTTWEIAR